MNKSFLENIVGSALAAQESQETNSFDSSSGSFSGITEKDGYVGEMVKASLAIFEAKTPKDYGTPFPDNYIVLLDSLKVVVGGTDMEMIVESIPLESIQELIAYIENQLDLNLDSIEAYYGSDNKIHMQQDSDYGLVEIEAGVSAYQEVEANKILGLPQK